MKKGCGETHSNSMFYVESNFLHAVAAATGCVGIVSSSGSNN